MKVLVINCGSSSVKYQLMDTTGEQVLVKGMIERIGFKDSVVTSSAVNGAGSSVHMPVEDHTSAMKVVLDLLISGNSAVIDNLAEIGAVGHRFVNGGSKFSESVVIDSTILTDLTRVLDLAPLHNPANMLGIEACLAEMPQTPQVAVFDTAFHAHIPPEAYIYALPYEYYENHDIRRYGFHGTSHSYVSRRAAEILDRQYDDLRIITCHLGNGCSIDAVHGGHAIETSMGLTPLEGLMMGTRAGDIDPAVPLHIMRTTGISPQEMDEILNKKSGLLGVSGVSSDMREVIEAAEAGNDRAQLAIDIYCYRIKKYIAAYNGILGGCDALVFTAGVGEHSPLVRGKSCEGLSCMGITIDSEKNDHATGGESEISTRNSQVKVLVIPTNEEIVIAREAERLTWKSDE
ncbi:acetate/propionate family kinase [Candidatus Latescibacterota bacterium]